MKKYLLITSVLCGLLVFASPGWSYIITNPDMTTTDVGSIDLFLYSEDLGGGANPTVELNWVNLKLGTSYASSEYWKTDEQPDFTQVEDGSGFVADVYAFALLHQPDYFVIKVGASPGEPTHYLFDNDPMLDWGVINFGLAELADIQNIDAVSHWGEAGGTPVPEPATMLLLGTGLIGLVGIGRRKFKKE